MAKDSKKKLEQDQINNLQKQADDYLEGWKRCKADFENYKKQQQDWAVDFRLYAAKEVLEEIIPVIDNFELAVEHIPQTSENKSWLEGIAHIKKQLEDILVGHNITVLETQPEDAFDPNIHECVEESIEEKGVIPASSSNPPKIAKVIQKGYKIGDKLLRPARVTLTKS
jgi:molecular chaperone GrpE